MPLTLRWTGEPGRARPGQLAMPHGLWQVTPPGADGRVELCYARCDEHGLLPGLPLPIGEFAASAEAALIAEVYEAALAGEPPPDAPPLDVPVRLLGPEGEFVLDMGETRLTLRFEAARRGGRADVAWMHRERHLPDRSFVEAERPPGIEDPAALDAAILLRIATLRLRRAHAPALEPLTRAEAAAWRTA